MLKYFVVFSIVFQGNGSICIEDRTGNSDMYPSYTMFTTSQRPWLRPLLTTPAPPVASGQYPGSVSVASGQYQCRREEDCHEHASCVYQRQTRRYRCQCDKWYEGDGWETCKPG